ncbi:sigma 54 modulation/S30EA ribosomal C-terminal domain-containing protein [Nonomuraea sp. NPDC048826]|uniref:sigma 54 modulation/S30EA ribosomal C-terminal domain-containing protein n=1 Tax=Nonomuraea sp. NPDC048826 TaxID=3364347 RepID=UPI00371499B4
MRRRNAPVAIDPADVRVETRGPVRHGAVEHARQAVAGLALLAHEPVLFARIKLTAPGGPDVKRPYTAQANLDVNGRLIRAQAAGPSMYQALDLLEDRIRTRLRRTARHWEELRGRYSPERRESSLPVLPRPRREPDAEREIVRHKTLGDYRATPEEAAFDMEQLDFGFYLFTEAGTGQDSVLYRDGDGYRLAQVDPRPEALGEVAIPLPVDPGPAPRLTTAEAADRLEAGGRAFEFFADAETGRGRLIYHRYDGGYGLITIG